MSLFNNFPYSNTEEINLDYTLNKLNELYSRGENLYAELQAWKTETDEANEAWKSDLLSDINEWQTSVTHSLEEWKTSVDSEVSNALTALSNQITAELTQAKADLRNEVDDLASAAAASAADATASQSAAAQSAQSAINSAAAAAQSAQNITESAEQIETNKNDITDLKSTITTCGILTPPFELGSITYNTTSWGTYTDSNSRVRVPSGSEVELNGGDIIYCDSSIVAYYSCTADNSKWTVRGWITGQIVAPFSGKYSFLLRRETESAISDISDVTSKFAIFSGGMSSIFYDTSNFVNIIGLENTINRSYIKYSTGEEVFTGSNIFTRKFSNPVFKKLKAFCTSLDAMSAAIGFYSTTTAESASYISGVSFQNNSANGSWFMADVPENCKLVTVTSRSDGNPVIILANAEIISDKIIESYYNKPSFFIPAKPRIIKHGGDSVIAPENSLPLFNLAGRSGYWGIETDIRQTSDNVLVCMHDANIDRTTTGTGAVASMTYEVLQNYTIDIGDYTEYSAEELRVPTFEEYLKVCRKYGCVAIIELYNIGYGHRVIDTIKKMGMEDSCVILSFASNIGVDVRTWAKNIPFIRLYTAGTTLSTADIDSLPPNAGFAVGADANGDVSTYNQNLLDYARTNNRYIGVWTVNALNIEKWEDAGLDMITVYSKS